MDHSQPQRTPEHLTSWWRDLALLACLLAVPFLAQIGARSLLLPDEGRYGGVAYEMLSQREWVVPTLDGLPFLHKPPLYYWLAAASLSLFGVNEAALRLVPALFGIAGCLLVYALARVMFDRRAALWSAGVLAASPLWFLSSQYANMDLQVAFWIGATLACLWRAVNAVEPRRAWWVAAAAACAGAATLTKGLHGIVLPGLILVAYLMARRRWRAALELHPVLALVLWAAIAVPWAWLAQQRVAGFFDYFVIGQHFGRFLQTGFNNPQPWWFYLALLPLALLPWSLLWWHGWRGAHARAPDAALWLALWAALTVLFFSIPSSKIVGYILPAALPLAMFSGVALARIEKEDHAFLPALLALAILSIALLSFAWVVRSDIAPKSLRWIGPEVWWLPAAACAGTAGTWWFGHTSARRVLLVAVVAGVALLQTLLLVAARWPQLSTAELARAARPLLQRDDVVIHDQQFYYDFAFYAWRPQPALVAADWSAPATRDNWFAELRDAAALAGNVAPQLIRFDDISARCLRAPRCWLLTSPQRARNYLSARAAGNAAGPVWRVVSTTDRAALLTDRPLP